MSAEGISIIIPNFNGEKLLKFPLISLANQTFPKNMYEVIIVDNASTDNSLKVIEEIKSQYPNCEIKVIRLKKNFGYGRAINVGVLNAKYNLILASNNDIIFHPKYLENIYNTYRYAKKIDERVVAAQGLHMYFPEVSCIYNAGGILSLLTGHYRFCGICLTQDEFSKIMEWADKGRLGFSYIAFPNGAGALIEKEVFLKIGGYYRLYFSGVEEVDLGLLLHLLGYRVIFAPSAIFYHMVSRTLGGRSMYIPHKLYLILSGLSICALSFYEPKRLVSYFAIYMFVLFSFLLLSIIKQRKELVWVIIKTIMLNIKMKRAILYRRSRLMRIKKLNLYDIIIYLKGSRKYINIPKMIINVLFRYL